MKQTISGWVVGKILSTGKKVVRLAEITALVGGKKSVVVVRTVINALNQNHVTVTL